MWEETSVCSSAYFHVAIRTGLLTADEMPDAWREMGAALTSPIRCHAAVLMSSHAHVLVSLPESSRDKLDEFTSAFENVHLQPVTSGYQYLITYEYIYRNPVVAGLAADVLDYPFSTLPGLFRGGEFQAIDDVSAILNGPMIVAWLDGKIPLPAHLSSHIDRRMRRLYQSQATL